MLCIHNVGLLTFPIEDCSHKSRSKITSQVGRDGHIGKSPYHISICKANHKWSGLWRHKRICWVKNRPDYKTLIPVSVFRASIIPLALLTMKLSTKNSMKNRYPKLVCVGAGNEHKIDPGPPSVFGLIPAAAIFSASAVICGWYCPTRIKPARKAPKT